MGTGIADRLRLAGERVTPQRLTIASALADAGQRQTAGQLWRRMRRRDQHIGRATVFRSLEALVSAGVARRLELENHVYGYVACQPEHHHHLACTACGRVSEIDETFVRPVAERVQAETGFQIDDARLDFYGRCANCVMGGAAAGGAAAGPRYAEPRAPAAATTSPAPFPSGEPARARDEGRG